MYLAIGASPLIICHFVCLLVCYFLTSFFGALVILLPLLPLMIFPVTEKFGKWVADKFIFLWKLFAVAMYEVCIGIKVIIQGEDNPHCSNGNLIILNHRTRLDWLFLMSYQIRYASLQQFVISLKAPLKYIPGPGWAMQCGAFLFLQRKWELDRLWMTKCIQYFQRIDYKPQLLIFPEGTDFTDYAKARSDAYAEKMAVKKYSYVLHPRTTGFVHLVTEMKKSNCLDALVDVTVGYPKFILHDERDIIYGQFPEEIHFFVQTYNISDLPSDSESIAEWCQKRWAEKEKRLEEYYTCNKKSFPCENNKLHCDEGTIRIYLYLSLAFWLSFLILVLFSLVYVWYFKWYCVLAICIFSCIQFFKGGVDDILFSSS
ncbi:hypothetical protein LOTGIDRAFT_217193 [Lottia gigantea]|uniref:Phospholipid/glycerol acyltransferase domain-containing protein n=1 Tax=Lottia gigantea TaxID=225164 RepID=V4BSP0_LOTGI|nr:hypothetical protein LOTGIDRAFT_217193 [Lottia gigantea]ESO92039.1 hypothetical protein LOTGIDRAFT_217193 [Lottia gigantea]